MNIKEAWDMIVFILLMVMTGMILCLALVLAYRIGLEIQWQHMQAVNDCVAHNLNATDGSICLV